MAISNYTELANAIYAALDVGTDSLSAAVSNIILEGELRIMREVRTPDMESALNATISSGTISVPSDFVELKYAYIDGSPTQYIQLVSPAVIYERYPTRSADGKPVIMARDGSSFIFGPYPDSNYTVKGRYYKHLTAVQTSANAMFVANPDLYLNAALAISESYLGHRDSRIPLWESKYRMIKDLVNGEAKRSHFSGQMMVRPG